MSDRIMQAAASGDVKALLGVVTAENVNGGNKRKWTALHFAARYGQREAAETLLRVGADRMLQNDEGKTPHSLALLWGFDDVAALLAPPAAAAAVATAAAATAATAALASDNTTALNAAAGMATTTTATTTLPAAPALFFAGNTLNRAANERKSPEWVAKALENQAARTLVLSGQRFLLQNDLALASRDHGTLKDLVGRGLTYVFLGVDDNQAPWFAADLGEDAAPETTMAANTASFQPLRPAAFQLTKPTEAAMVAQARSILDWNVRNRFCAMCGRATTSGDGGYKRVCPAEDCKTNQSIQNVSYPRLDPVVIGLIVSPDRQRILLGRGKQFPEGMYSCLAGFMEPGENIEEAIRREAFEESGVRVGPVRYHSSQPWPFPSQLMIGVIAQALSEDIVIDPEELADCKWFGRADVVEAFKRGFDLRSPALKMPPKYAIAHILIRAWLDEHPLSKF